MKKIHLAAVLAIVCTVASGEEGSCDLINVETSHTARLIRDHEKAILMLNPNSVNMISVTMWCGGSTCVNLENEELGDGKLIIHGPVHKLDPATENVGGATYSMWFYDEMLSSVEEIELTCVD